MHTPDQNATDFTKCLHAIIDNSEVYAQTDTLLALGGLSGRFDHVIGVIQTLHLITSCSNGKPVFVLDAHSLICLLSPVSNYY